MAERRRRPCPARARRVTRPVKLMEFVNNSYRGGYVNANSNRGIDTAELENPEISSPLCTDREI